MFPQRGFRRCRVTRRCLDEKGRASGNGKLCEAASVQARPWGTVFGIAILIEESDWLAASGLTTGFEVAAEKRTLSCRNGEMIA